MSEQSDVANAASATRGGGWLQGLMITVVTAAMLVGGVAAFRAFVDRSSDAKSLSDIEALMNRQQWEQAEKQVASYLAAHPSDPTAIELYARSLAAREAFAECAQVLEQVGEEAPERGKMLFRAGQAWLAAADRRNAERVWIECLAIRSDDAGWPADQQECRRQLCDLFALERRRDELWKMTEQMVEHAAPRDQHGPLAMRARYRLEMVEPAVAAGLLTRSLDINPKDAYTRRAIGLYELEAGNSEKARDQLFRCLQQQPSDWPMHEAWLECLSKSGAETFEFELALEKLPAGYEYSAAYWAARSILTEKKQQLSEAIEAAERAIELDPSDSARRYRVAQLLTRAGRAAEAEQATKVALALQEAREELQQLFGSYRAGYARMTPKSRGELAFQFGQAYEALQAPAESAGWYRVALAEDPAHSPSLSALDRVTQAAAAPAE